MSDKTFQTAFDGCAKDGKLSSDCIKKWFKDANIIGKDITEADVDKVCKDKKEVDFAGFKECINNLAKEKKKEPKELMEKLAESGAKKAKDAVGNAADKVTKGGK